MSTRNGSNSDDDTSSQPDAKRQRKIYLGGPVEEEETAEKKLADKGFDKGNYTRPQEITITFEFPEEDEDDTFRRTHTLVSSPMVEFCRDGDLKMCRYLLMRGALADHEPYDDECGQEMFPLLRAALSFKLDICKWLRQNGADIRRRDRHGFSILERWLDDYPCEDEYGDACRWFVLNGIFTDQSGFLCNDYHRAMRMHMPSAVKEFMSKWFDEALKIRKCFLSFLGGTIDCSNRSSSSSSLLLLSGNPGILEVIAEYLGVIRGRHLRIIHQLKPMVRQRSSLPTFVARRALMGLFDDLFSNSTDTAQTQRFVLITMAERKEFARLRQEASEARLAVSKAVVVNLLRSYPECTKRLAVMLHMAPDISAEDLVTAILNRSDRSQILDQIPGLFRQ